MMETLDNTIESKIAAILDDIRQKGFSSVQPFSIGKVEARMSLFAQTNAIMLGNHRHRGRAYCPKTRRTSDADSKLYA